MPNKLQIKLLSKSGELLNCINCFSGQISVLRSVSPRELEPYRRALAGLSGPERFSLVLDDQAFRPEEHVLIGFGESFSFESRTLGELLIASGVPDTTLPSVALGIGLEHSLDKACRTLTPCEERRARLCVATYSPHRVLVLHEPFEPIASQWRERVADILLSFAKTSKGLVVISGLSYRPDRFIDNPAVSRLQVGENIQKTIGFGSDGSSVSSLVTQVREMLRDEEAKAQPGAVKRSGANRTPSSTNIRRDSGVTKIDPAASYGAASVATVTPAKRLKFGRLPVVFGALAILLVTIVYVQSGMQSDTPEQVVSSLPNEPEPVKIETPMVVVPVVAPPTPEPVQEPVRARLALDSYPTNIKNGIIQAFEGSGESQTAQPATETKTAPAQLPQGGAGFSSGDELINFLKSASQGNSGSEPATEPQAPSFGQPDDMSNLNEEEKREAIRQKFLEAINRAAQNRRDEDL